MGEDEPLAATEPQALVFGQRWSLRIGAAPVAGPKRFSGVRAAISGMSAGLPQRMKVLANVGVLARTDLPPLATLGAYALTDSDAELAHRR